MKAHPMDIINQIAEKNGAGSKAIKEQIAADHLDVPEFIKVVEYALNPWKEYYVTVIPGLNELKSDARKIKDMSKKGHVNIFDKKAAKLPWKQQFDEMFKLLDDLSTRKLAPNSNVARQTAVAWAEKCGEGTIELFQRILKKDLRCGMQESSFNKVKPGWVPTFDVQLAQPFNMDKIKYPCYVEPKFDGERCLAFVTYDGTDGEVLFLSRNGKQHQNFGCFASDLLAMCKGEGNTVVDCEVINKFGFQTLQKLPSNYDPAFDTSNLQCVVFDIMPQSAFESQVFDDTQEVRKKRLSSLFKNFTSKNIIQADVKVANNYQDVEQMFDYWVKKGLEGIIIKDPTGKYEFKRSYTWIKQKRDKTDDLEIVDVEFGMSGKKWEGKCGSLIVRRINSSGQEIRIGVKSGLLDYDHENIQIVGDQILWKAPTGEFINIKGKLIEVKYDQETDDGSLRFPRIIRRDNSLIRLDKN